MNNSNKIQTKWLYTPRLETRTKESSICASIWMLKIRMRNESKIGSISESADHFLIKRFELEHTCWDPKDGELCLNRVKSEETLMEARKRF